jgi:hypothetical protein
MISGSPSEEVGAKASNVLSCILAYEITLYSVSDINIHLGRYSA